MTEIRLIGINLVHDQTNFPYFVSWEGIDSLARNMQEAECLAAVRVKYFDEDSTAAIFKVTGPTASTLVKQYIKQDNEISTWQRK